MFADLRNTVLAFASASSLAIHPIVSRLFVLGIFPFSVDLPAPNLARQKGPLAVNRSTWREAPAFMPELFVFGLHGDTLQRPESPG